MRHRLLVPALTVLAALSGCSTPPISCDTLDAAQSTDAARTCAFAAEITDEGFEMHGDAPAPLAFGGALLGPDDRPPLGAPHTAADGTTLLSRDGVAIWNADGRDVRRDSVGPIGGTALSPAGRWALALADGRLLVGEPGAPPRVEGAIESGMTSIGVNSVTGEPGIVLPSTVHLAFSPDGAHLAGIGGDDALVVWDADTGKRLWRTPLGGAGRAVAVSPDGARVAASTDETVSLWEAATGEALGAWTVPRRAEAFTFDGAHLAAWFPSKTTTQLRHHSYASRGEHHVRTRSDGSTETLRIHPRGVAVWRMP